MALNINTQLDLNARALGIANQRLELLAETERRFKKMLNDMRGFNEEQWSPDSEDLREELNKALVVIDNTRKEYN